MSTIQALNDLAARVLGPGPAGGIRFHLRSGNVHEDGDWFSLEDGDPGQVVIAGNTGISLAAGLRWYLAYRMNISFDPVFLPATHGALHGAATVADGPLPPVGERVLRQTPFTYRYALNYCTYSYSMAFWTWREYEPFLDWLALNGVNLVLDIVGQEEVVRRLLMRHGYTDEEVRRYLPGPAYLAWFHMINLCGTGGPLPASWFVDRLELARRIHARMAAFGMEPVMPGFSGAVPADLPQHDPRARVLNLGDWFGITRPAMLEVGAEGTAADAYFSQMAHAYYDIQDDLFGGIARHYSVDPYHEGKPPAGVNIAQVYQAVQRAMLAHRPGATWVMQQWEGNVTDEKLASLVEPQRALVLDLHSEVQTEEGPTERAGVPWIWCELGNFGGRRGITGPLDVVARVPELPGRHPHLCGIGLTAEALEGSPAVFDLLFETAWHNAAVDVRGWLRAWCTRRYGAANEHAIAAWGSLLRGVLHAPRTPRDQEPVESVVCAVPSIDPPAKVSPVGHCDADYDPADVEHAMDEMRRAEDALGDTEAFRCDLIDIQCQMLTDRARSLQREMEHAYGAGDLDAYRDAAARFLELIDQQDALLAGEERSRLARWTERARTVLPDIDGETERLFVLNALSQVTTWDMGGSATLMDYSNRQWNGLLSGYYRARWSVHIANRTAELEGRGPHPDPDWFAWGQAWVRRQASL